MNRLGELELKVAAKQAAGNWRTFSCFIWFKARDLKDADNWTVIYHSNRDSGLLDQSNAAVIEKALRPFTEGNDPDVVFESHSHWAVGHVDGASIRVFRRGRITKAFKVYHEMAERMADYPILDESDYSEREYEATYQNVGEAAWRMKREFDLPDGWQSEVYSWLSENRDHALESRDDQGGWPDETDLEAAFEALGFQRAA